MLQRGARGGCPLCVFCEKKISIYAQILHTFTLSLHQSDSKFQLMATNQMNKYE